MDDIQQWNHELNDDQWEMDLEHVDIIVAAGDAMAGDAMEDNRDAENNLPNLPAMIHVLNPLIRRDMDLSGDRHPPILYSETFKKDNVGMFILTAD